jgi:hypothetical protein
MRLLAAAVLACCAASTSTLAPSAMAGSCSLHYVAGGDDIAAAHGLSEEQGYPAKLLNEHLLKAPGAWCKYGEPKNGTTSSSYIKEGQMALAWNREPDLITLSVGEQNSGIVDILETCLEDIKKHDFEGANTCASEALADLPAYEELSKNLSTILDNYMLIMSGRPELIVAVVGYPDPYPSFDSAEEHITELCTPLVDTITNCLTRWEQFPPALELIDQVFKKLNSTLADEVKQFTEASQGRFVFVNPSSSFSSHCMKMEVDIQTTVSHNDDVEEEDGEAEFGCSTPWWSEGDVGLEPPTYLAPAESGELLTEMQETTGMGAYPNEEGQSCIAELIWAAVKIKLGVPQAPGQGTCEAKQEGGSGGEGLGEGLGGGSGELARGAATQAATASVSSPAGVLASPALDARAATSPARSRALARKPCARVRKPPYAATSHGSRGVRAARARPRVKELPGCASRSRTGHARRHARRARSR